MTHPLAGKRIAITRPEAQAADFVAALRQAGAIPIIFPTIQIAPIPDNEPLDSALRNLNHYAWVVFTSVNGVKVALDRLHELGLALTDLNQCRVAVIGPATAAALTEHGVRVDVQPAEYIAEAIVVALAGHHSLADQRFLLLRADIARPALRDELIASGAIVDEIPVYQTVQGNPEQSAYAELRTGVDVLTFTSSSTVRHFFDLLGAEAPIIGQSALIACIGPITAKTAQEMGLRVDLVAEEYTIPGLMAALTEKLNV
ncbi:MAG: uroporphyrinogen-III synthase [Anaerolineae bacterium]|nr:uroporphyrinogen-III synthase [Anaerolineae bacterium]